MDAWLIKKSNTNEQSRVEINEDNAQLGECSRRNEEENERKSDELNANEQSMP